MSNSFYGEYDAPIAQGAPGTTTIVSGTPGHKIRLTGYAFTLSAAGTAKFVSGSTDKTGAMTIAENGGMVVEGVGITCGVGEDLKITTTVGSANGHVTYQRIPA